MTARGGRLSPRFLAGLGISVMSEFDPLQSVNGAGPFHSDSADSVTGYTAWVKSDSGASPVGSPAVFPKPPAGSGASTISGGGAAQPSAQLLPPNPSRPGATCCQRARPRDAGASVRSAPALAGPPPPRSHTLPAREDESRSDPVLPPVQAPESPGISA